MKDILIKEYLSGKSISQLNKEYKIPYRQIQKILNENNIQIRGGRKKKQLSEEQIQILKKEFDKYTPLREIGKQLNCSLEVINRYIKDLKLE